MTFRMNSTMGLLFLALTALACSSIPSTDGTSGGSATVGGSSSGGAASTTGTGTGGSTGGTSSSTTGSSSGGATLSLPVGDCYTFATKTEKPYTTSCGDLMALGGARVDLSNGAGSSQLCQLLGTYTSLDQVPASYAACQWTNYVEGGDDLANQGLIVLDSSGTHHYRVWISSNAPPDLLFEFAPID